MKINVNFWLYEYVAHFFIEWVMFQTKVVEEIKKHILCSANFFSRKTFFLWDNVERIAGHATDDNMAHAHCMLW